MAIPRITPPRGRAGWRIAIPTAWCLSRHMIERIHRELFGGTGPVSGTPAKGAYVVELVSSTQAWQICSFLERCKENKRSTEGFGRL